MYGIIAKMPHSGYDKQHFGQPDFAILFARSSFAKNQKKEL
jgi:hypothetical protein